MFSTTIINGPMWLSLNGGGYVNMGYITMLRPDIDPSNDTKDWFIEVCVADRTNCYLEKNYKTKEEAEVAIVNIITGVKEEGGQYGTEVGKPADHS